MNNIKLSFEKSLSNLAGYEFGVSVYEKQAKGKLDLSKNFTIEFPPEINGVASSFVQGFFEEIVKQIGLSATEERTKIVSVNPKIEHGLLKKLQ